MSSKRSKSCPSCQAELMLIQIPRRNMTMIVIMRARMVAVLTAPQSGNQVYLICITGLPQSTLKRKSCWCLPSGLLVQLASQLCKCSPLVISLTMDGIDGSSICFARQDLCINRSLKEQRVVAVVPTFALQMLVAPLFGMACQWMDLSNSKASSCISGNPNQIQQGECHYFTPTASYLRHSGIPSRGSRRLGSLYYYNGSYHAGYCQILHLSIASSLEGFEVLQVAAITDDLLWCIFDRHE